MCKSTREAALLTGYFITKLDLFTNRFSRLFIEALCDFQQAMTQDYMALKVISKETKDLCLRQKSFIFRPWRLGTHCLRRHSAFFAIHS
jgi:hypothetical protein